jgi:hypothetical protein
MGLVNEAASNQRTSRFEGAAELNSIELIGLISCHPGQKMEDIRDCIVLE